MSVKKIKENDKEQIGLISWNSSDFIDVNYRKNVKM